MRLRVGPEASLPAHSAAAPSSESPSTTRPQRPIRRALSAGMSSAKKASSLAFCRPTSRGKIHAPSPSGTSPRRANTSMNRAWSAITTRSQHRARWAPTPAAVPLTAATTGSSQSSTADINRIWPSSIARRTSPVAGRGAPSGRGAGGRGALRSAPVQKLLVPVAVTTAARASNWPLRLPNTSARRSRIPGVRALPRSGLSMVTQATWSRISSRTRSSRSNSEVSVMEGR